MLIKKQRFIENLNFAYTDSVNRGEVSEVAFITGSGFNDWFYYNYYSTTPPVADGVNVLLGRHPNPNGDDSEGGRWVRADSDVAEALFPAWEPTKAYVTNDRVQTTDGIKLLATADHTSGATLDDTELLNWRLVSTGNDYYKISYGSGQRVDYDTPINIQGSDGTVTPTVSGDAPLSTDWNVIQALGYIVEFNGHDVSDAYQPQPDGTAIFPGIFFEEGDDIQIKEFSSDFSGGIAGVQELGITDWEPNKAFTLHQGIYQNGSLYRASSSMVSGTAWDATEQARWEKIDVGDATTIGGWQATHSYIQHEPIVIQGALYRAKTAHTSAAALNEAEITSKWELLTDDTVVIEDWQATTLYRNGATVRRGESIYRSTSTRTSGANFDATERAEWIEISHMSPVVADWAPARYYRVNQVMRDSNGKIFRAKTAHTSAALFSNDASKWDLIIDNALVVKDWQASTTYFLDQLVFRDGAILRATSDRTSRATFDALEQAGWVVVTIKDAYVRDWAADTDYEKDQVVTINGFLYRAPNDIRSGATWDNVEEPRWQKVGGGELFGALVFEWAASTEYLQNQVVRHEGNLWRSNSDRQSGATFNTVEEAQWTLISSSAAFINDWAANKDLKEDQTFFWAGIIYRAPSNMTTGAAWSASEKARYEKLTVDITELSTFSINTSSDIVLDKDNGSDRNYNRVDNSVEIVNTPTGIEVGHFWNVVNFGNTEITINNNSHTVNPNFHRVIPPGGLVSIVVTAKAGNVLSVDIIGGVV